MAPESMGLDTSGAMAPLAQAGCCIAHHFGPGCESQGAPKAAGGLYNQQEEIQWVHGMPLTYFERGQVAADWRQRKQATTHQSTGRHRHCAQQRPVTKKIDNR